MPFVISKPKTLIFTRHARAKMAFYKLSEARVRRVLHSPRRTEEGVAPKTVAMMQPASIRREIRKTGRDQGKFLETWSYEIWVMFQESPVGHKIISAWRYPGITKPRSPVAVKLMQREYNEFIAGV
jgi:hypothetical protein